MDGGLKYLILTLVIFKSILLTGCFGISEKDNYLNMETVANVDIERFMGDWYVIGNIPTFIEKGATNAIESYKLGANGRIETTFTLFKDLVFLTVPAIGFVNILRPFLVIKFSGEQLIIE